MNGYIINPPIINDLDYYRNDDEIIEKIINGQSMLAIGLRRSGKTSFLKKVDRRLQQVGRSCVFLDIRDYFIEGDPSVLIETDARRIKTVSEAVVLIDEIDAFENSDSVLLEKLLNACLKRTIIMACAPRFVLDINSYSKSVQELTEGCNKHAIGPLTKSEAFALLSQSKRRSVSPIKSSRMERVWRNGDRLPIILQALGAKHSGGQDIVSSLAGVGASVLQGINKTARDLLVQAAHGDCLASNSQEAQLLAELGALCITKNNPKCSIAGSTLREMIRHSSSPYISSAAAAPSASIDMQRHARILHLSDLHFGPHCIEKKSVDRQLERLTSRLEQDSLVPDYVAITGDLSWSGHKEELNQAEQFLEGLVKWLSHAKGIKKDKEARKRFLIIPGNHEAAWKLSKGISSKQTEDWAYYSLAPFASLFNRFHRGDIIWDLEKPCQSRCFDDPSVAFVLTSTVHLITQRQKDGLFGDMVQNNVVRILEQKHVQNANFRICLTHHSLRPFHNGTGAISDVEAALLKFGRCKPTIDLYLHGHVHQGEADFYKPRRGLGEVAYSSVGSFGVRAKNRPGDDIIGRHPNEFAIVDLETTGTGRRFVTQFYHLSYTTTGDLEWNEGSKPVSKSL